MGLYGPLEVPELMRSIQAAHFANTAEDYSDIAYNWCVDRFGDIWEARGMGRRSGANGGALGNSAAYAVCYLGGPGDPLTPEAAASIAEVHRMILEAGGSGNIWPHRHWVATQCPGEELVALVDELAGGTFAPAALTTEEAPDMTPDEHQLLAAAQAAAEQARISATIVAQALGITPQNVGWEVAWGRLEATAKKVVDQGAAAQSAWLEARLAAPVNVVQLQARVAFLEGRLAQLEAGELLPVVHPSSSPPAAASG